MRRPVLIVIDMLNDFLESWASAPREELIQSTNGLIGLMHSAATPSCGFARNLNLIFVMLFEK